MNKYIISTNIFTTVYIIYLFFWAQIENSIVIKNLKYNHHEQTNATQVEIKK